MSWNIAAANPVAPGCTCLRIRKAARLVTQIYDRHLEPFGLTITQYGLLAHLRSFDGIGIGTLAARLIMDPTTLTRSLRPLERRGLITLAPDPDDRRTRLLRLTDEGRSALADARPAWKQAQAHIENTLGMAELSTLHTALDGALEHLAE